jgi:hypothetical protein
LYARLARQDRRNRIVDAALRFVQSVEAAMTKSTPHVPDANRSHKGPGSAPEVSLDTTKGHRNDENNNIEEQGDRANMRQNTTNRPQK